ncbi:MAG: YggS family pyridoxal phosphate-dependent enzyme [Hydrogenothermaceae bacterium]|nr:YggS family pyridoxal phosphate-dependent enzyme [Hydrogenothermaceae bacterium]
MDICTRVEIVRKKIERACDRAGRNLEEVILLAASKTQSVDKILEAYRCGVRYFGENRVQEGVEKINELIDYKDIHWHLIGGLQINKAKHAVNYFQIIHSLDREELANEINKRAERIGKIQSCLIEVNFGEESKYGVDEDKLFQLFEYCQKKNSIKVEGLMAIPPYFEDVEKVRPFFAKLRDLKEQLEKSYNVNLKHLSMGMSRDFEVAIEEGATIVRIGSAIFGERS